MNKYMKIAIDEARSGISEGHGGPFGSVIVKDGVIVGRGHNEVVKQHDCTCHGEIMAIRDACARLGDFDLSGCELYTTSEPCVMCTGAIMWSNISKVYYGCTISDAEDIGFRDKKFDEEIQNFPATETDRSECLELFADYASIKDKTMY